MSRGVAAAGIAAHVGEPAWHRRCPWPGAACLDRQDDPRTGAGRWPRAGAAALGPAAQTWSTGRCWRPATTCAVSTPPGSGASTRSSSTRAPWRWRGRCAPGRAWPRCARPRPLTCRRGGSCSRHGPGHARRPRGPDRGAAHAAAVCGPAFDRGEGAGPRPYGVGPVTALPLTCWPAGQAGSPPPARRSGSPGATSPSGSGPQRPARAPVRAGAAGAALAGVRGWPDPRPRSALGYAGDAAAADRRTVSAPPCRTPASSSGRPATS